MTRQALARRTLARALPFALLLAYGLAFGVSALGGGALGFDDHPGQLYRVWHVVNHGPVPWRWNDGWWAGYPELQFYPPGFAYAAALFHGVTLGRLPVELAYHAIVWVAYLAPGVTTYALLQRVLGSGWLALPGAFVALTLSAGVMSGVEGGVRTGMVAARLAWALVPLVALTLHRWIDGRAGVPLGVAPALGAIVVTHPAHAPAAVALVALAAVAAHTERRARLLVAGGITALGVLLTAFWSVPLVARLAETRALAWGDLTLASLLETLLKHPLLAALLVLAAAGTAIARTPLEIVVTRLPWVMAAIVTLDRVTLEPLGARWLPADRVVDGAWLAVIVAAGFALGRLVERLAPVTRTPHPALAVACVALAVVVSLPNGTLTTWPRARDWPGLTATARGLRLDELWASLARLPAGRILFVRSAVPLVYGHDWWRPHTHVTALAPLHAGRAILNGTFTHPSPIAALVYRGSPEGGAITALAETLDGRSLFGRPLASLDTASLGRIAERLRISAIVAIEDDVPQLAALDGRAGFARVRASPPFVMWARSALDLPAAVEAGRWRVSLSGEPGEWISAGVAYYPLWRATDGGTPIPTRRGDLGDLEVRRASRDGAVELRYAPGAPEIAGLALSVAAAALWIVLAARRRGGARPGSSLSAPTSSSRARACSPPTGRSRPDAEPSSDGSP